MGKQLGRADITLEFPVSMIKHQNSVDLEGEFLGLLRDWRRSMLRMRRREGWKKGMDTIKYFPSATTLVDDISISSSFRKKGLRKLGVTVLSDLVAASIC
jgi:hypothetical protein